MFFKNLHWMLADAYYQILMDMCLPKFDIYQGTVAPNCFKGHTNSSRPDFFQQKKFCLVFRLKLTLSDVTLFLPENLFGLKKKLYSGLFLLFFFTKRK